MKIKDKILYIISTIKQKISIKNCFIVIFCLLSIYFIYLNLDLYKLVEQIKNLQKPLYWYEQPNTKTSSAGDVKMPYNKWIKKCFPEKFWHSKYILIANDAEYKNCVLLLKNKTLEAQNALEKTNPVQDYQNYVPIDVARPQNPADPDNG